MWHALRTGPDALIDLRLFTNRTFAAASGTLILFVIAVFGTMLLLPLYLQTVRGESALQSGLLLAPQGIGAMLVMPIAGQLTDRIGIAKLVIPGTLMIMLATLGLTQLAADTSYWTLSAPAVPDRHGHGRGDDADHVRRHEDAAPGGDRQGEHDAEHHPAGRRVDRHRGALGDPRQRARRSPAAGRRRRPRRRRTCPTAVREQIAPLMADAFGATFWYARRRCSSSPSSRRSCCRSTRPRRVEEPAEGEAEAEPIPVALPV